MSPRLGTITALSLALLGPAVAAAPPSVNDLVISFCERRKGEQVGNGECCTLASDALRAAGARGMGADSPGAGDYTWGRLVFALEWDGTAPRPTGKVADVIPGDIIQFRGVRSAGLTADHHTAVVAVVAGDGRTLRIFHQNFNGKKVVVDGSLSLSGLQAGWIRVYRPVPDVAALMRGAVPSELAEAVRKHIVGQRKELESLVRKAIDAGEDDLRSGLASASAGERFAAAYAVGERKLFCQDDLISLLKDEDDAVRQAARRSLVLLSYLRISAESAPEAKASPPKDFGPRARARAAAREAAVQAWDEWWKVHGESKLRPAIEPTKGDRLATRLLETTGARRGKLLTEYAEASGAEYTEAIALAAVKMSGAARKEARQALADRLSRRTEATLLRYLEDGNAEIRRAAALALGMRDAKGATAAVAELLLDAEPSVVRAAHASLVSLTGEDYGPGVGATDEERAEAHKRYRAWKEK